MNLIEAADALADAIVANRPLLGDEAQALSDAVIAYRQARSQPLVAYVVTSGEYSDYRINSVYLDQRLAERDVELQGSDGTYYGDAQVETWLVGTREPERAMVYSARGTVDNRKPAPSPVYTGNDEEVTTLAPGQVRVHVGYVANTTSRPREHIRYVSIEGRDLTRVMKTWTEVAAHIVANIDAVPVNDDLGSPEVRDVEP